MTFDHDFAMLSGLALLSFVLLFYCSQLLRRSRKLIDETKEISGYWSDKVEGLEADLDSVVEVAFNRGAHEWVRLNYPEHYERLRGGDVD